MDSRYIDGEMSRCNPKDFKNVWESGLKKEFKVKNHRVKPRTVRNKLIAGEE